LSEVQKTRNSYYTDKAELFKHITQDEDKIEEISSAFNFTIIKDLILKQKERKMNKEYENTINKLKIHQPGFEKFEKFKKSRHSKSHHFPSKNLSNQFQKSQIKFIKFKSKSK